MSEVAAELAFRILYGAWVSVSVVALMCCKVLADAGHFVAHQNVSHSKDHLVNRGAYFLDKK